MPASTLLHEALHDKAREAFATWPTWTYGQLRGSGRPFFILPASDPARGPWYADTADCTCPDQQYRQHVCKHMAAVRLWCRGLLDGTIPTRVVEASERRALFAEMAMRYDLEVADQADALLVAYDQQRTAASEAQVVPDDAWLDEWPEPPADDGRPVWLADGDRYAPDVAAREPMAEA